MLFYPFLVVGLILLLLDLAGRLRVSPESVRSWRRVGVVAAAGPGLIPTVMVVAAVLGWPFVSWPFPLFAAAYLVLFVGFAVGVLELVGPDRSLPLRRLSYLGLLLLAAIPSWVLFVLWPLVALAGVGLVRERPAS